MMRRSSFFVAATLVLVVVVAIPVLAQEEGKQLVLADGSSVGVLSAEVRGDYVYAKMVNGSLQAFLIQDVDLAQSNLLPTVEEQPPEETDPLGVHLADAKTPETTKPAWTITDADVQHTFDTSAAAEGEEEGEGAAGTAAKVDVESPRQMKLSAVTQKLTPEGLVISGVLTSEAEMPLTNVTVGAIATDKEGKALARGRTTLDGVLDPGASGRFAVEMKLEGRPTNVRVYVETTPVAPPS